VEHVTNIAPALLSKFMTLAQVAAPSLAQKIPLAAEKINATPN